MADPLTVVGAVASVVQLIHFTTKVLTRLDECRVKAGELPSAFAHIASQLPLLRQILEKTQEGIKLQIISQEDVEIIQPCLQGCQQQMQKLDTLWLTILPEAQERTARRVAKGFRSLWKDSDVRKIDAEIGFFVARLNFYCSWSSSKLDPRNRDLLVTIQQRLAPPDPFTNLHKALKLRSANTGKWYLQGDQFEAYKAQTSYFGWLYGSAGSGKTILSASIVNSLQHFCSKDPARSLAFFFFDFNDVAKQDANNMVKSLLSQFLQKCTRIPDSAQRLSTAASEQQLLHALRDVMETLPMPFVVLDALDECNDRNRLFEILEGVHSWGNKSLHMLVTSRKEVEIEDTLEDLVLSANRTCLESHLVDEDIRTYVHERLTEDKSFRRWQRDPEIQEEIEQTLGKQACGMFRWAACQLDTLAHCLTRGKVRRALQDLPKTLYDTYDRMILKIDESPNGEEALNILRFLTFAQRPLSAEELLEVTGIVLTDGDPIFDKDEVLQDLRDILRICLSLVSIIPAVQDREKSNTDTRVEPTGEYIRLAHFSVKEYLVSTRPCLEKFSLLEKDSHDILATSCLVYLHRFQGEEWKDCNSEAKFPLTGYAAVHWTHHAPVSDFQSKRQRDLCMELLTERLPAYKSWHRFYDLYLNDGETDDISREITEFPSPLFAASGEGLVHVVYAILEDENANIDATWNGMGSALCQASKKGYRRIVELLLAKGANPNVQRDQYYHALVEATRYGDKKIVEMLLDAGADVHAEEIPYGTAFDAASEICDKELMEMLLAKDANLEARGECYGQALIQASITGREDLVEVLLANGADVKVRRPSALDASMLKLLLDCAESFLARGAVPNGSPDTFGTALAAASFVGLSERIVEMLLANGADVEARGVGSLTPLQLASYRGNTKIAQMLLAQGADVNAQPGCWYGSAMMAASIGGHQEIIQMLQAKGARLQKGEWEEVLQRRHDSDSLSETSIVAELC
ncbi:Pfs, NACHT and ankyrin domain protein [Hortaea werneckii]|nr:Pfs, NACHT and ankyrin domain protein [Hortaea werneckii]KAI6998544.1 Pfs, NACHT and ankyrin domain protein [Hortaea werneckii]KAI7149212.1 Pfs, NACHT and ankyrin domain protein [Hortaea werneckii]